MNWIIAGYAAGTMNGRVAHSLKELEPIYWWAFCSVFFFGLALGLCLRGWLEELATWDNPISDALDYLDSHIYRVIAFLLMGVVGLVVGLLMGGA